MKISPIITVLMPVYNGEKYLSEAVESILNQTFTNFEFIIVNDGSTDRSRNIILSYSDSRIKLIDNHENLGLPKSLNKGINSAKGKYIARMDADDISLPNRLTIQYNFMENNKNIGVCGAWLQLFGNGNGVWKSPVEHEEIKENLLFNNCIWHPTVLMRTDIFNNKIKYDDTYTSSQDYELWTRLVQYTELHNLPQILLKYRIHDISKRKNYKDIQKENANKIRKAQLKSLGIADEYIEKYFLIHEMICYKKITNGINYKKIKKWKRILLSANNKNNVYDKKQFRATINREINFFQKNKIWAIRKIKKLVLLFQDKIKNFFLYNKTPS